MRGAAGLKSPLDYLHGVASNHYGARDIYLHILVVQAVEMSRYM